MKQFEINDLTKEDWDELKLASIDNVYNFFNELNEEQKEKFKKISKGYRQKVYYLNETAVDLAYVFLRGENIKEKELDEIFSNLMEVVSI